MGRRRINLISKLYLPGEELGASEDKLPVGDFFPSPSHSPGIKSKPTKLNQIFSDFRKANIPNILRKIEQSMRRET